VTGQAASVGRTFDGCGGAINALDAIGAPPLVGNQATASTDRRMSCFVGM
jgi:hypothetical protein